MKIFLNLLPPERKAALVHQYYWRYFLEQWFLVALIIVGAGIVMGALYFRIELESRSNELSSTANVTTEHKVEYTRYEEKFESTNRAVRSASGYIALHTSFSDLLRQIEQSVPENTKIKEVSTQSYQVFLLGTTDTRDTFLRLQENLKQNSCFENINTPLSNLFSETNVEFEIDFTVKTECLRGVVPKI